MYTVQRSLVDLGLHLRSILLAQALPEHMHVQIECADENQTSKGRRERRSWQKQVWGWVSTSFMKLSNFAAAAWVP